MACATIVWGFLLLFGGSFQLLMGASEDEPLEFMSKEEREALKEEARDMFYHAYNAYMDNAYPADELMPLSCKGRYRGSEPNRGDIDATLGNFSMTLVDTLDTLVVLGDLEEFENAVKLVSRDVTFDTDVVVSLFETNIRMLGGLLSGHILAEYLQQRADIMPWYRGELLDLAKDLGYRFLPAFNTTTGIPYGRINLRHGMKGIPVEMSRETCTACAGSMILEMAALSRLTGEPVFEEKAQKSMDVLWRMRHRGTDLMGSVLNVNSGDWVRRDSGVGAGIDSYYEYCLKAYILLGDEKYLGRFNRHYQAVMKYVSQGPMLLDVHMHRPNTNSKNFMDALLAFWPGLQVLKGDIKPAVETHEMLYQVMQRHNFIPEAFTTDFQVHWGHHPLRPEFLESTYFLYRATGDHYYLGVGRKVLRSLQTYARVPCGYAAVSDVRTNKHDDAMDSFVLSETFKYLFLLFSEPSELILDLDEFIFTTEGHLLPLTLASIRSNSSSDFEKETVQVDEFDRACPNSLHLFPASVRQPLRNMVEDVCPRRNIKRKLNASQFQASNLEHLTMLSDMGITILTLADGRVQLLHTFSNAKTAQDAEEGLLFMQEMVELSKMQTQQSETRPQAITFSMPNIYPPQEVILLAGPAHFGPELRGPTKVTGKLVYTDPPTACSDILNADKLSGKIVIMARGNCMFVEKARRIQKAGAIAGVVLDNVLGSSAATSPMFAMSGDGREIDDVTIPVVFLFSAEATRLVEAIVASHGQLIISIGENVPKDEAQLKAPNDLSMFERLKGSLKEFLVRQITPQNSVSDEAVSSMTVQETRREEDHHKVIIEYAHLKAVITQSLAAEEEQIRVTASDLDATIKTHKESEEKTEFEKKWQFLRQMFVNQIFSNTRRGSDLYIKGSVLMGYYKWVQTERGLTDDVISNINLSRKVYWFLKELSVVAPEKSGSPDSSAEESMDINRQKLELLRQHLLSKMDDMAFLKSVAMKFKSLKSSNPEMEQLFKQLEFGEVKAENYGLFGKLLREIFEGEDESVSQHIALLDHLQKAIQANNPSEMLINHLRKDFGISLGMKNFPGLRENDVIADEPEGEKTPENRKSKINRRNLEKHKYKQGDSNNLDEFEHFILTEMKKAADSQKQNTPHKIENIVKSSIKLESENSSDSPESSEPSINTKTRNGSKDIDRQDNIENAMETEMDFLKNTDLQETRLHGVADEQKRGQKRLAYKEVSIDEDMAFAFPKVSEVASNSVSMEEVTNDERQRLLQEIQEELSVSQRSHKNVKNIKVSDSKSMTSEEVHSRGSLEDFTKPVWASDEGKVMKEFSEFQKKADISGAKFCSAHKNDFGCQDEFVIKDESTNTENRDKHISGEL